MGTVLSSFGTAAVVGGRGGGGRGGARKRPDGSSFVAATTTVEEEEDDSSNVKASISAEATDKKHPPSTPGKQWPCSNCHSMVASDQVRCSNCHGIQVRIHPSNGTASAPPNFVYLERVVSPSGAAGTTPVAVGDETSPAPVVPSDTILREPVISGAPLKEVVESDDSKDAKNLGQEDNDDDDGESATSDYYDNDGMDDVETLEASPRPSDFVVGEIDELRPMNPVAATLASVPSPIPVPLKLDAARLHPSSPFAAAVLEDEATISLSDGYEKKRPALLEGGVFAAEITDGAIQLLPSKKNKKLRMS